MVNNKGKISWIFTICLSLILIAVLYFVIGASPDTYNSAGGTTFTVNEDAWYVFNISVNNTAVGQTANITQVNITIPSSFNFVWTSNNTNSTSTFSNHTGIILTWTNNSGAEGFVVNGSDIRWFSINASAPNPGTYYFNTTILFGNGTSYSEVENISVTVANVNNPTYTTAAVADNTITNDTTQVYSCNVSYTGTTVTGLNITFWNSSGAIYASNFSAVSGTYNSTNITHTISVDGNYTWNCKANNSYNNVDWATVNRTIVIDTTAPTSPSFSCDDSTPTKGQVITCTCDGSTDATSGINSTYGSSGYSYTVHPSTDNYGTFTLTCTVRDNAGNTNTTTTSYTVASGNPGSDSSGISTETSKDTKIISTLNAGESQTITGFAEDSGIEDITIKAKNEMNNIKVIVKKYDSLPSSIAVAKEGKVYGYLEIDADNLNSDLDSAVIKIKVEKSWLSDNNLNKDEVALYKLVNDEWEKLDTKFDSEDNLYNYYTVTTDSFSYYSIAGITSEATLPPEEKEEVEEAKSNLWMWIIIIVVVLIIVGVIVIKKKREEY